MALGCGCELEDGGEKVAAVRGGNGGEPGAVRVLFEHCFEPRLETGLRLRGREIRPKAAEDLHPAGAAVEELVETGKDLLGHGGRDPERRDDADIDAAEAISGDADDGEGVLVEEHLAAEDIGIAAELRLPEIVGEND